FLIGRQGLVGIGGHGHGRFRPAQGVADAVVVFGATDQDANRLTVCLTLELIINDGHIEIEFASVFGLEFSSFEFNDEVAQLLNVEEQQVDVIVVSADLEMHLASNKRKARTQFS